MYASDWKTVLLDYDRSSEFTGDDVDRYSAVCDLGDGYEFVTIFVPALDSSGTVSVYVQRDEAIATVPVIVHAFDDDATGSFAHATSSGAGSIVVTFRIGGCRYFRIYVGADQSANRTFYAKGINRMTHGV